MRHPIFIHYTTIRYRSIRDAVLLISNYNKKKGGCMGCGSIRSGYRRMRILKKAFKTEIRLNDVQIQKFHQSIGVCRWLYNQYIARNKEQYQLYLDGKADKKFLSANDFDKDRKSVV